MRTKARTARRSDSSSTVDEMTTPAYSTDEELINLIELVPIQHQLDLHGTCDSASNLARLHDAGVIERAAHQDVEQMVRISRKDGATWAQIGDALGVTRQAAQQRFGDIAPDAP